MTCPHCTFENPPGAIECVGCGIIFARSHGAPASSPAGPPPSRRRQRDAGDPAAETAALQPIPWKILAVGFIGALVAHATWLTSAPFEALKTLFHELGHAVVAWLLGHPSIPAFDLMFGGGITHYGEFHPSIAIAVAAGMGYLGWRLRQNTLAVSVIGAVFLIWLIVVTKEWRRETVMASAGVVFELLLAATFMYMTIANVGWRIPEVERPLGALIAFFVQFDSWIFALRLMRDEDFLAWYQQGKGGALMNDLEVVALNLKIYLGINATIRGMAEMLFLFSFIPMSLAVWLATPASRKFRERLDSLLVSA